MSKALLFSSLCVALGGCAGGSATSFADDPAVGRDGGKADDDEGRDAAVASSDATADLWGEAILPPDAVCGAETIPIELKDTIPELQLVVDRSGSMAAPIDFLGLDFTPKWTIMERTLGAMIDAYRGTIRFGLTLFPSQGNCDASTIDVPIGDGNEDTIKGVLANRGPDDGFTPTHTALETVYAQFQTLPPPTTARFVLLATDGIPNCGAEVDTPTGAETLAAVTKLAADGVKTFVLGFGGFFTGDAGLLDDLATAGGAPNVSGSHQFYPATNEAELKAALLTIAGNIVVPSCTYELSEAPPDPDNVKVTFDGQPVPRDPGDTEGWNYTNGGDEITLFGDACQQLESGAIQQVAFTYGCPGPVIN